MDFINYNKGLRIGKRETDYVLGSSPVEKQILTDGDWRKWSPEHEHQFNFTSMYDSLMCVSFSATDAIEYLFTWALHNGRISADNVKWLKDNGYFKNGLINFSERFVGTLGDTTTQGAYQYKVADAIRKFGLIPQDDFPLADSFLNNIDKKFITQAMYDKGAEFIKRFPIAYEWTPNIRHALKYGPVQVCVYYQDGNGILCPGQNPQHAVVAVNSGDDFIEIDDSYNVQYKKYCPQAIYSGMLYTIKFNNMTFKKEKGKPHIYWVNESKNTKTMIVDMPSLNAMDGQFTEVDSLSTYTNAGTFIWVERIIE